MGDKKEMKTVLIVGSTGVGKTAICYNLGDDNSTSTSQPVGTTLSFLRSEVKFNLKDFTLVDTCGFNESKDGSVTPLESVEQFMKFVKANKNGFNMVVLVKREKNDINLDKNLKLIQSLMPGIPIHLCVQGVKSNWGSQTCECSVFSGPHNYDDHTPPGIKHLICVDLPGKDKIDVLKSDEEWTTARQRRLEEDQKRLKDHIVSYSNKRFPITSQSVMDGFKEFLNVICGVIFGKAIFVTESIKKVIAALVELGVSKGEAEKTVYEYARK